MKKTKENDVPAKGGKFDLPNFQDALDELDRQYKFSDNPNLSEIAKLALEAYVDQMKDIQLMEPKYRARSLEVANQYLTLAKDALSKDEDLRLKEEKQNADSGNGKPTSTEQTVDRKELLLEIDRAKRESRQ